MSKGMLFWVVWIIVLLLSLWLNWGAWPLVGFSVAVMIMLGLVGWAVFGAPVQ